PTTAGKNFLGSALTVCLCRRAGQTIALLHQQETDEIPERAGDHATENVGDVVVASPDCGDTHRCDQWQHDPEKPAAMAPGSPHRSDGASDVLGRKCGAADATIVLDEIDRGGEWPPVQFTLPHAGHGKPWTLNRKKRGDKVSDRV